MAKTTVPETDPEWVERESFISWVECSKCGLQREGGHV